MAVTPKTGAAGSSAKKATANTEIVLGAAAQQITKAVNELNNACKTISQLTTQSEELTLLVANKEEAITNLETQFSEKERQLKVDLDLSFKSNTERVVTNYLNSVGQTAISTSELNALRTELETVMASTEETVRTEVASAVSRIKTQYEAEIKLLHSDNKAVAAENSAKIGTLTSQNTFLQEQVDKLYEQLNAERQAGIQRAQSSSVGTINLSAPTK